MLPTLLVRKWVSRIAAAVVLALSAGISAAQTSQRPWLMLAKPTVLEWLILELQTYEGDPEFGENHITVAFHGGPRSATEGVIYCQVRYLPAASAELVQLVERGIRERFDIQKKTHPWAKLEINTEVARPKQ
jgi:hypothetical protein